ncbi:MAG TPA: hypothetical protein VEG38_07495 [Acidimicrobiia bacterium]|nr:hypothetical protein [Acidimicrobiia bacterium]
MDAPYHSFLRKELSLFSGNRTGGMMKKVLTAAIFSGLLAFGIPGTASAQQSCGEMTAYDHDHGSGDCAGAPQSGQPEPEASPEPARRDHAGEDSDEGEFLLF